MGKADVTDHRAGPRHREGGLHRLSGADAFEHAVHADAAGELHDGRGCFLASALDDVGGPELVRERLTRGMATERDDALSPAELGGNDGAQTNSSIAYDRDRVAFLDPSAAAAWWPVPITSDSVSIERSISSE